MHKHAYIQCGTLSLSVLCVHTDGTVLKTKNGKIENYESMLQSVNDATSNRTDVNLEVVCFFVVVSTSSYCHQKPPFVFCRLKIKKKSLSLSFHLKIFFLVYSIKFLFIVCLMKSCFFFLFFLESNVNHFSFNTHLKIILGTFIIQTIK